MTQRNDSSSDCDTQYVMSVAATSLFPLETIPRGLSSNGTENLHKDLGHASSIPMAFGSRSGLSSPRATVSGSVKA